MARIDWAVLCDHAFLDQQGQLCMIGIVRSLAPAVRRASRLMLVARLTDIQQADELNIEIGIVTPSGLHTAKPGSGMVSIEMTREYVFATLRDVPLQEDGTYRFQIRLRGQPVVAVEIPVLTAEVEQVAVVQ